MLGQAADVGDERSQRPALAATAAYHCHEILNRAQRLAFAAGELREDARSSLVSSSTMAAINKHRHAFQLSPAIRETKRSFGDEEIR